MLFSAWEFCGPCGNPSDLLGPAYLPCRKIRLIDTPSKKCQLSIAEGVPHRETVRARGRARLFWSLSSTRLPAKIWTCNLGLLQKHHDGPKSQPSRGGRIARRKTLARNEERSCLGHFAQRLSEPGGFRMRVARRCC